MLTNKELVEALIVNLKSWDWEINSKFGIDKKTGDALVEVYKEMTERLKNADNGRTDVRDM